MYFRTTRVALTFFALLLASGFAQAQPMKDDPEILSQPGAGKAGQHKVNPKSFPQDLAGLQALAIESYQAGDYMRFVQTTIKLRELRPFEQQYLVGMVVGGALIGRPTTAYNYMHVMQQEGLSYDFNSTEDTQSIRKTEVYDYLNGLLIEAGKPAGEGRVAFTLPDAAVQPEAIAWDAGRGVFLVGNLETGAVLSVTPGGDVKELLKADDENGLLSITGIAVDATHNKLWLSSAGIRQFAALKPENLGHGAVFEFELDSLKLLRRYSIPEDGLPHAPGSIELTSAGDVYVIDRAVPMVFRKMASDGELEAYLASKDMTGFTDLAVSDTGETLYVADSQLGILVVDLASGAAAPLVAPETLNLGGISGLSFSESSLLMIQNGITPQRLMRLKLDPTGKQVSEVTPLAMALEEFTAPASGVVEGGAVYYFAGSNQPGQTQAVAPVIVMKSPLELSEAIITAEQRKYDADTAKKKKKPGEL